MLAAIPSLSSRVYHTFLAYPQTSANVTVWMTGICPLTVTLLAMKSATIFLAAGEVVKLKA